MNKKKLLVRTRKKTGSSFSPDVEKIRQRAYDIWEQKGRPQNSDLDNWLEAEREMRM